MVSLSMGPNVRIVTLRVATPAANSANAPVAAPSAGGNAAQQQGKERHGGDAQ
jgi:hypothetical protein